MIVELIVRSETFALCTASDAARDIKLARCHIVPDTVKSIEIGGVVGQEATSATPE